MGFLRLVLEVISTPIKLLLSAPGKLFQGSRRLSTISLAARAAILTEVLLLIIVIIAVATYQLGPKNSTLNNYLSWIVVAILVLLIPLALYKALQLWLEGDASPYPDIDSAWKAGLKELDRQGIDLKEVPLYLVLGTSGIRQEKLLFDAARLELGVRETPAGMADLHWYASQNSVYLVCSEVGSLSALATLASEIQEAERSRSQSPSPAWSPPESASIKGTFVAPSGGFRGTFVGPIAQAPSPQAAPSQPSARGTMIGPSTGDSTGTITEAPRDERRVLKLDPKVVSEQERRLAYLSRLICRYRQPICPINGILTLIPYFPLQRNTQDAVAIGRAIRSDLNALQQNLMIYCAVTALVVGIEEENGFRELVRRVGRESALNRRFGRSFLPGNVPLGESLEAVAINACGAFELFVYNLFRERDALSKPGNTKLYSLLCKIRHKVQKPLCDMLDYGFAIDPSGGKPAPEAMRFTGCYFAGAGESEDRQAFVAEVFSLFEKPDKEKYVMHEELQWDDRAIRRDDHYSLVSQLIMAFDLVLLLALAAEIIYFIPKSG